MLKAIRCVVPACLALVAAPGFAQTADQVTGANDTNKTADTQQQLKAPPGLTGDWGGLRSRLRDDGVDLTAGYTNEFAANVTGGARRDQTDVGQAAFGATVDTGKLFGLQGGTLQATITYRHGHDLGKSAGLGVLQQIQANYGRNQTWHLTDLWYRQDLGSGVDLKVGRLDMSSDFATFSCDFENLSFCGTPEGNIVGDYWYNAPLSQWAGRLRVKHSSWYAMAGVYESNPNNADRTNFTISHTGARGVTVPAEYGWTPSLGRNGLPGTYKIGGWYNSDHADDVLLAIDRRPIGLTGLAPLQHAGRYGGYVMLQQQLTGRFAVDPTGTPKSTHGLSIFANITQADRRTARTDNQMAVGLFFIGPIGGRPEDDIGFAVGRTNVNGRAAYQDMLATPGGEKPDAEYLSELYYSIHVRSWLIVRPDLQYIVHPGGYRDAHDVVVLGTKSAITF